jgi:hypothetical protein
MPMQIDKQAVMSFLQTKGKKELLTQAERELPALMDHVRHADLLQKFGINPEELLHHVRSGNPGP